MKKCVSILNQNAAHENHSALFFLNVEVLKWRYPPTVNGRHFPFEATIHDPRNVSDDFQDIAGY